MLSETFLIARGKWAGYRQDRKMTPWAWLYRLALDALYERWRKEHLGVRDERREMPFPEVKPRVTFVGPTKPTSAGTWRMTSWNMIGPHR